MAQEQNPTIELDKKKIAEVMKDIDICMMTTTGEDGILQSRPMSNNREVEWDGDNWFFCKENSSAVADVQRDPHTNLAFSENKKIVFLSLAGQAEVVRDTAKKEELWQKELEMWFPEGPADESLVLIKVKANEAHLWSKEGEGKLAL